ncbi:MAG: RecQ family ATP-dependent DNA helicase [Clostridiales bacterium]|nr:RecQ family ATP-dependent DNA helicase [Clostridiales bacterium]
MSAEARQVLLEHWGYSSFRACQEEIIDSILDGHDTLGLMPTGGGKSITFQVPALMLPGITLVVTPLISLMKDQVDNLRSRGIKAIALHSGLSFRENNVAINHLESGRIKILYVSPEKLTGENFFTLMRNLDISLLVVDEAHCISQWGYDFRPSYMNIATVRKLLPGVPVLALTASATPEVVADITSRLKFANPENIFRMSFARDNISYIVRNTDNKLGKMTEILLKVPGTAIVYVRSRKRTLDIARSLQASGISAEGYHAGLTPELKSERQNNWKNGSTRVIVATNAFGMGIDKPDVRLVIHHDIPPSLEEYYQEAGRAGRDGKESYAVMLVSQADKGVLKRRLSDSFPPRDYIRDIYGKACVFSNTAMGEGFNTLHEFNFRLFCERYALQPVRAHSALTLLSNSGYFNYLEDYNSRSRVMVVVDKQQLYNLHLSPAAENVLQILLRSYTGLFADYEYISEPVIASRAGLSEQEVYEAMLQLARQRVIHYVPRTSNPMLLITASRVENRHVVIPVSIYEERLESMKKRIESMIKFAFSDSGCRNDILLRYFGETPSGNCGKCDYCRSKRTQSTRAPQSAKEAIRTILTIESPIAISQLIANTNRKPDTVIDALRAMCDEGEATITNGMVSKS